MDMFRSQQMWSAYQTFPAFIVTKFAIQIHVLLTYLVTYLFFYLLSFRRRFSAHAQKAQRFVQWRQSDL